MNKFVLLLSALVAFTNLYTVDQIQQLVQWVGIVAGEAASTVFLLVWVPFYNAIHPIDWIKNTPVGTIVTWFINLGFVGTLGVMQAGAISGWGRAKMAAGWAWVKMQLFGTFVKREAVRAKNLLKSIPLHHYVGVAIAAYGVIRITFKIHQWRKINQIREGAEKSKQQQEMLNAAFIGALGAAALSYGAEAPAIMSKIKEASWLKNLFATIWTGLTGFITGFCPEDEVRTIPTTIKKDGRVYRYFGEDPDMPAREAVTVGGVQYIRKDLIPEEVIEKSQPQTVGYLGRIYKMVVKPTYTNRQKDQMMERPSDSESEIDFASLEEHPDQTLTIQQLDEIHARERKEAWEANRERGRLRDKEEREELIREELRRTAQRKEAPMKNVVLDLDQRKEGPIQDTITSFYSMLPKMNFELVDDIAIATFSMLATLEGVELFKKVYGKFNNKQKRAFWVLLIGTAMGLAYFYFFDLRNENAKQNRKRVKHVFRKESWEDKMYAKEWEELNEREEWDYQHDDLEDERREDPEYEERVKYGRRAKRNAQSKNPLKVKEMQAKKDVEKNLSEQERFAFWDRVDDLIQYNHQSNENAFDQAFEEFGYRIYGDSFTKAMKEAVDLNRLPAEWVLSLRKQLGDRVDQLQKSMERKRNNVANLIKQRDAMDDLHMKKERALFEQLEKAQMEVVKVYEENEKLKDIMDNIPYVEPKPKDTRTPEAYQKKFENKTQSKEEIIEEYKRESKLINQKQVKPSMVDQINTIRTDLIDLGVPKSALYIVVPENIPKGPKTHMFLLKALQTKKNEMTAKKNVGYPIPEILEAPQLGSAPITVKDFEQNWYGIMDPQTGEWNKSIDKVGQYTVSVHHHNLNDWKVGDDIEMGVFTPEHGGGKPDKTAKVKILKIEEKRDLVFFSVPKTIMGWKSLYPKRLEIEDTIKLKSCIHETKELVFTTGIASPDGTHSAETHPGFSGTAIRSATTNASYGVHNSGPWRRDSGVKNKFMLWTKEDVEFLTTVPLN